ncbi:MAG: hypothetical protein MJ106_06590 [Lentisphaeria bacterium]|nr:hypothetical protein [Lentisphaeria bacterium]
MNTFDLLSKWPGWEKASAENIFDSPAWAMPVRWGDIPCLLRRAPFKERDVIGIGLHFDDDENFLGIGNRAAFPDLSQLWDVKQSLPDALKLALVEKECGRLLQILENGVRRQVSLTGIVSAENREGCTGFEIVDENGKIVVSFVMKVTPDIVRAFGQMKCIDVKHPSIREMTRPANACYASFMMTQNELSSLSAGDFILLPETKSAAPYWIQECPMDETVYVLATEESTLSFAEYADEALPEVPSPNALRLVRNGRTIACGRMASLKATPAFAVEEVF